MWSTNITPFEMGVSRGNDRRTCAASLAVQLDSGWATLGGCGLHRQGSVLHVHGPGVPLIFIEALELLANRLASVNASIFIETNSRAATKASINRCIDLHRNSRAASKLNDTMKCCLISPLYFVDSD